MVCAVMLAAACGDDDDPKTYSSYARCAPGYADSCGATNQSCGAVTGDAPSCPMEIPPTLDHPATTLDAPKPIGCAVGLTFGNPNYQDSQVVCTCGLISGRNDWTCPI